jgi:hypothetical protein
MRQRQGVLSRQDEDKILFEERLDGEFWRVNGGVQHGEVKLTQEELRLKRGGGALGHEKADSRVITLEDLEELGEEPSAGGADDSCPNSAGDLGAGSNDIGQDGFKFSENVASSPHHQDPFFRESTT